MAHQQVEVGTISWAVPLQRRKTEDIVGAAAQGWSRLRPMGIPVRRRHADRAREFTSKAFRKWAYQRDRKWEAERQEQQAEAAQSGGEQLQMEEMRSIFHVMPHDEPRRRMHGKTAPSQ